MNERMLRNGRWIQRNYAELSEKYPMEYVAVADGRVIAHHTHYNVVERVAERKAKDYMISYVESGGQIITPFFSEDFD